MRGMFNTLSVIAPTREDPRDEAVRAFSGGVFGFSPTDDARFDRFVFARPMNHADRQSGGICCVTGYWAPGHRLVSTPSGRAIDLFAPLKKETDHGY